MGRAVDEAYRNALLWDGAPLGFLSTDRPELPFGTTRQVWWEQVRQPCTPPPVANLPLFGPQE